jgi:hypothetical protein
MKSHKVPHVYTLTDDDMDRIGYQVWDVTEEEIEEASWKQDEQHQKVQDQLMMIQQLLETVRITPERGSGEGPSMSPIEEAGTTTPFLSKLAVGHRVLEIVSDAVEFPMQELQEKVRALSHLDLVISRMPTIVLQSLHIGIMQEIRLLCRVSMQRVDQGDRREGRNATKVYNCSAGEERG